MELQLMISNNCPWYSADFRIFCFSNITTSDLSLVIVQVLVLVINEHWFELFWRLTITTTVTT